MDYPEPSPKVKKILDKLCKEYEYAPYSFGHVVIDDYNLEDGCILGCFEYFPRWLTAWIKDNCSPAYCQPTSNNSWERFEFDDIMNMTQAIMKAFLEILDIPEDERYA